nr:hypothetical protein TetV2_00055 [Oceanusvirus sp.]
MPFLCCCCCVQEDADPADAYIRRNRSLISSGDEHVIRARLRDMRLSPAHCASEEAISWYIDHFEEHKPGYHAACRADPTVVKTHLAAMKREGMFARAP